MASLHLKMSIKGFIAADHSSLAVSLLVAAILMLPATLPRDALANVFFDDSFYYFDIARHLAQDGKITFDGLHGTAGFQPLWLFLITPLFWGSSKLPNPEVNLRAVIVLQALLVGASAYYISRTLSARVGRLPAAIAALSIVALPGMKLIVGSGMESALVLLLLVLIWRYYVESDDPRRLSRVGAVCALAFLARPETLVAPFVLACDLALKHRFDRSSALRLGVPSIVAVMAYLLFNYLVSGLPLPTSALIKTNDEVAGAVGPVSLFQRLFSSLPVYGWAWTLFEPNGRIVEVAAWGMIVCAIAVSFVLRKRLCKLIRAAEAQVPLAICFVYWLVQSATLKLGAPWYGVWLILGSSLLLGAAAAVAPFRRVWLGIFVIASISRGLIHTKRSLASHHLMETRVIEAADWMSKQARPGELVGSWNAGLFAYYCSCSVVNLDGLVNDSDFYRQVIVSKMLPSYLVSRHIYWLADDILTPSSFSRPSFGLTTGQLEGHSISLVKTFCFPEDSACNGFGVWRFAL